MLDTATGQRRLIPYAAINLDGADVRIREKPRQGLGRNELAIGDRVGFVGRDQQARSGRVVRLDDKTVPLDCAGQQCLVALTPDTRSPSRREVTLAGLTGIKLQEMLRTPVANVPVIAVSARDEEESVRLARQLGARFFFHEPPDGLALLDAIKWVTGVSASAGFGGLGQRRTGAQSGHGQGGQQQAAPVQISDMPARLPACPVDHWPPLRAIGCTAMATDSTKLASTWSPTLTTLK